MTRPVTARRPYWIAAVAAVLLCGGFVPVFAEIPPEVPDKLRFAIGGMAADAYTDAALGSVTNGLGAAINFEDTFNLPESKDIWRFEVNWRINKRQFLDLGYLELNRSASRIIQQDVSWGDFVYQPGAKVTSTFESNFPYIAWRYSFLDLPQVRISGSAGFNYLSLKSSLAANGNVKDQNGNDVTGQVDERVSVAAPVPQIGLQIDWDLNKKLAVLMYIRQIYINNIEGIDGGIGETALRLQWWYVKHAGISVGLDKESIDLKRYESGDTRAQFRYEVRGLSFYFNFGW